MTQWRKELAVFAIVVFILIFAGYEIHNLIESHKTSNTAITDKIASIDTKGEIAKPSDPSIIMLRGTDTVKETVSYVPKEITTVLNPNGTTSQVKEKTDVQIQNSPQKIYVKVNGKIMEVPSTVLENSKFENGKLIIEIQQTSVTDIKAPLDKEFHLLTDVKKDVGGMITFPIGKSLGFDAGYIDGFKFGISGKI